MNIKASRVFLFCSI